MVQPTPAPSLRELSRPPGVTEGVSSVGCSGPTVYTPAHINSEIFERVRSSGYTPSVSHSLDSSLREGAGIWCVPFNVPPGNRNIAGDFHRPYENSEILLFYHSTKYTPSASLRSAAPSEREPGTVGLYHSMYRPETATWRAIFIAPTKTQKTLHFTIHRGGGAAVWGGN